MYKTNILTLILVTITLVSFVLFPTVNATEYVVTLNNDHFDVSWRILAWQNITGYCNGCLHVFPNNVNYSLNNTELSKFTNTIQTAFRHSVQTITISHASVQITSNKESNSTSCKPSCPRQWYNVTMNFQVQETSVQSNSVAQYDMSWKALTLNDSLVANGNEFNLVGEKYLASAYAPIVNTASSPSSSVSVHFGNRNETSSTFQNDAKTIVMLDMSRVRFPLDNWTLTPNLTSQQNVWTAPRSGGFLTYADQLLENSHFFYFVEARITAQIFAPLSTYSKGDTLYQDLSNGLNEKIQFSIVIATIGVLAATVVLERRISHTQVTSRRRDRRK